MEKIKFYVDLADLSIISLILLPMAISNYNLLTLTVNGYGVIRVCGGGQINEHVKAQMFPQTVDYEKKKQKYERTRIRSGDRFILWSGLANPTTEHSPFCKSLPIRNILVLIRQLYLAFLRSDLQMHRHSNFPYFYYISNRHSLINRNTTSTTQIDVHLNQLQSSHCTRISVLGRESLKNFLTAQK